MLSTVDDWNGFWINLATGGIFFVAEIVLLVVLLPIVLSCVDRRRWQPQARAFVTRILEKQAYALDVFAGDMDRSFDSDPKEIGQNRWLNEQFATPLSEHRNAMTENRLNAEAELHLFARALTPEIHRAFVDWRESVRSWENALESFAIWGAHWVRNGQNGDSGRQGLVSDFRLAFSRWCDATRDLREVLGLPDQLQRIERPDLDLRLDQLFASSHFGQIETSLDSARNGV